MKIFSWNDILISLDSKKRIPLFEKGTGISIGSFDGLHLGHRSLLQILVKNCKEMKLLPGVISFERPLPGIKHHQDYQGDVSTLKQRLKLFEESGIEFAIIIDFNQAFAALSGTDFLNLLINACNMQFIAEGIDFRFGYKGATDVSALKYFAQSNNIGTSFVEQVIFKDGTEEERVSSSYIRSMISKGFMTTAEQLLLRPYSVELSPENVLLQNGKNIIQKKLIKQVLPPSGIYHCKNEKGEEIRLKITDEALIIDSSDKISELYF